MRRSAPHSARRRRRPALGLERGRGQADVHAVDPCPLRAMGATGHTGELGRVAAKPMAADQGRTGVPFVRDGRPYSVSGRLHARAGRPDRRSAGMAIKGRDMNPLFFFLAIYWWYAWA